MAAKHVLVIGSGIIGASIAYHLAKQGADVTIVEGGESGGLATRNSWAWINASWGNPEPYFRLRTRSMREWRRVADEVPAVGVKWQGGLCWDLPPDELEAYRREHAAWGYGLRAIGRDEARHIEPNILAPPEAALHVAEEGKVEPLAAAQALLLAAVAKGARLVTHRRIKRLVRVQGRVIAADTDDGSLHADTIVLAAGAGSVHLAESVGIVVPLATPPGLLVHSRPLPHLLNGLVISPKLHVRQTTEGRLVAGSDFGGADPGASPGATAHRLFAEVQAMIRGGDRVEYDFYTIGYRPTPQDGFPMIGAPSAIAGLYLAVMHSGITLAPAVGLFAARELLTGERDPLLTPYHPDRFA